MADSKSKEKEPSGLKKSLRLIYVYAIAAGAIFTFIGYWDTVCIAVFFIGNARWYILEGQRENDDFVLFGIVVWSIR